MRWQFVPMMCAIAMTTEAFACANTSQRQFDFWIGEWEVHTGPSIVGKNTVSAAADGCALREEWRGTDGSTGTSLTFFDAARSLWHQTWIGSDGGTLYLEGKFVGDTLHLEGKRKLRDGKRATERIRWTPLPDGKVRQLWDRQLEGQTAWRVVFDGLYERAKP
jgi:hypothetical protein